ncbi:Kelch repeat-containing protein [Robertkochia flava]|uniref:Kelch repeat-containing protein n=1 Tax=Robertkochia flava TaxID=3447986 RepID=UPI001CCC9BE7|nr:kelch repeat-containing protein [Robertkochia marina]
MSDCNWNLLAPSAVPRLESYPVIFQNRLFAFTGFTNGLDVSPETEIYDFNTGGWSMGAPMPVAVTHMGVALADEEIWVAGGFEGDNPGVATAAVQIYNPRTNQWREGPELPFARASGSMVFVDGKLHHFGGLLPDRRTNVGEHWVLDTRNPAAGWRQKAELPEARNHLGGVALNGNIYAIGGQFGHDGSHKDVALFHVYNSTSDTWRQLADLPVNLSHIEAGVFAFENRIYVVGGESNSRATDTIFVYDPQTDSWSEFCTVPNKLIAPGARIYGNDLVVLNGGLDGACCPVTTFRYINLTRK